MLLSAFLADPTGALVVAWQHTAVAGLPYWHLMSGGLFLASTLTALLCAGPSLSETNLSESSVEIPKSYGAAFGSALDCQLIVLLSSDLTDFRCLAIADSAKLPSQAAGCLQSFQWKEILNTEILETLHYHSSEHFSQNLETFIAS